MLSFWTFVVLSGLILLGMKRFLEVEQNGWMWWIVLINHAFLVVASMSLLYYNTRLRRMEDGWCNRAREILSDRAFGHVEQS